MENQKQIQITHIPSRRSELVRFQGKQYQLQYLTL
nr:MAG TPA: hypothetical protein [Caudoviricetes sp.]